MAAILWVVAKFFRFNAYYAVDYGVFLIVGLLPWAFLTGAVNDAAHSFVENAALMRKVYFPRAILPMTAVLSNLVNFLLGVLVIFGLLVLFGRIPLSPRLLLLPLAVFVQLILVTGLALITSVGNAYFRDVGMLLEFVLQAWFYLTPVFYPVTLVVAELGRVSTSPHLIHAYAVANPMLPVIYTYRWSLLSARGLTETPPFSNETWPWLLASSFLVSTVILVIGILLYRRFQGGIADEV
jgi:ABC-type polysaccharide/polyol phosphate export permease